MPRWDLWRRELYLWTLTLAALAVALAWVFWSPEQAQSVAAGAVIGLINLHLLSRAAFRMVVASTAELEGAPRPRFAPLMAALRWPLAALATASVLWYMAGQPEGLVAGVSLAFLGLVVTSLRTAPLDDDESAPRDPP